MLLLLITARNWLVITIDPASNWSLDEYKSTALTALEGENVKSKILKMAENQPNNLHDYDMIYVKYA